MNNGVGPWWFPAFLRNWLTWLSNLFFATASWDRHDEGYERGFPSRRICDQKFLAAMLKDASDTTNEWKMMGCTILAWFFWLMVRLFGWASYKHK